MKGFFTFLFALFVLVACVSAAPAASATEVERKETGAELMEDKMDGIETSTRSGYYHKRKYPYGYYGKRRGYGYGRRGYGYRRRGYGYGRRYGYKGYGKPYGYGYSSGSDYYSGYSS